MDYTRMDLGKLLQKNDELSEFTEDHVICIVYNILCSLNFLDSANVLHRDLKPNNILIDANCVVKICDFGYARTQQTNEKINLKKYSSPSNDEKTSLPCSPKID